MSMLSAQIDGLRSCADLYDGTTKPEMAKELQRPHLAQELREAADTIWQLRDDLQRANAENARLRSELESVGTASYLYGRSDLKAENAKLREMVDGWDFCSKTKDPTFDNCVGCPLFVQTPHSYRCARDDRMRELGVDE